MPTHSRTPAHAAWAMAGARRPGPLGALWYAALLVVVVLCAVVHLPSDEAEGHPSALVTPSVSAPVAGDTAPHGPHRHQGDEECALDQAVRTAAEAVRHPPAEVATPALVGLTAALVRPPAERRPYRLRGGRHTGRAALVRTCRWRI